MRHGIDAYFAEIASFERRLSGIGFAVALALLAVEYAARHPEVVEALNDPKHFGFEGPEQYVRRIQLETIGPQDQAGANAENFTPVEMKRGGGSGVESHEDGGSVPSTPRHGVGLGEDESDLVSRIRALSLEGPIIRSEELVVEKLVRPEYPEAARDKDIEGVVELVALVDTTGAVTEVHIVGGTGNADFEQSATNAVLLCRYRPYRVREIAQRVWAHFRISFTLY